MSIDAAAAFSLGDLAVFDTTHLRQVIGDISGAVPPALAGRAFASDGATDGARETPPLDALAERIESALPPDDRAAFAQARLRGGAMHECESARRDVLGLLFWELTYWKTPEEYER